MTTKTDNSSTTGLLLIAAALGFILFQQQTKTAAPASGSDVDHARAYVAGDFAFTNGSSPAPSPDPKPKPGKCTVCNGTGKVGDGRIFVDCGTCGGDGVVEAIDSMFCKCGPNCQCLTVPNNPDCQCPNCKCGKEVQKIQETPEEWAARVGKESIGIRQVILYRNPDYPLPITDKALEALKASGWQFGPEGQIDVRPDSSDHKHGTWVLTEGGRELASQWIDMTAKQVAAFYESGKEFDPVKEPAYQLNFHHRSTWTHPGEIRQHLMSTHGFTASELDGLSNAQLEALHSSEHERGNPRRSFGRPMRMYRYCPNGNCP